MRRISIKSKAEALRKESERWESLTETERAQEANQEHNEWMEINRDQTESGPGVFYFSRNPTPIQQKIEKMVTNGAGYLGITNPKAPARSLELSAYYLSKENWLKLPQWTEELFEIRYNKPEIQTLTNFQLQRHLLEMGRRFSNKDDQLDTLEYKCHRATWSPDSPRIQGPTRKDTYYKNFMINFYLNKASREEVIKFLEIIEKTADLSELFEYAKEMKGETRTQQN